MDNALVLGGGGGGYNIAFIIITLNWSNLKDPTFLSGKVSS